MGLSANLDALKLAAEKKAEAFKFNILGIKLIDEVKIFLMYYL